MMQLRRTRGSLAGWVGLVALIQACGSGVAPSGNADGAQADGPPGAGCSAPWQIVYTTPGCGAEAIPRCELPNGDGCSMMVCLCDGVTTSGDGCGFSHRPYLYTGFCRKDAAPADDAPTGGDLKMMDGPVLGVDTPSSMDGARPYGRYYTIPDGRQLREVSYCLPILSLAIGARDCPNTLTEARLATLDAADAGSPDALPYSTGRPVLLPPCLEPIVIYLPHGPSLGWGASCYYDANSGQLLSVLEGSDTPTECVSSPEPNTAAFIAQVYGQYLTCTSPTHAGGG